MQVYHNTTQLPAFKNAVITIGTFDGVHKGHQQIIQQLIKEASAITGTAIVISFDPHPKQVVASQGKPLNILNVPAEKYELLNQHGIEHIVIVPFDKAFAEQTAAAYIENFLVEKFHPHTIIIGYDHRFGNNREGDYKLLESAAERMGFTVKEIPEHILQNVTISSTKIREALLKGDIETAENYLGYKYFFTGEVVKGNQLGRTIGYPTANLKIQHENKLVPANGVYAVTVKIEGRKQEYKGMMNIGVRPTVDGINRVIEVNIFDFDEMIYGSNLKITLHKQLRQEVKFNGLGELKDQLQKDRDHALAALQA
ncbi:MAG: bifunctional riboflavin kinase/FAD synthetase [Chitinophagaceae bacterium]|nr:MAG: bifunctional riboflavin kinase/FAD synthetase [Chitinophagaceae bacterium]